MTYNDRFIRAQTAERPRSSIGSTQLGGPAAFALQNIEETHQSYSEVVGPCGLEPQTWPTKSARSSQHHPELARESSLPISNA